MESYAPEQAGFKSHSPEVQRVVQLPNGTWIAPDFVTAIEVVEMGAQEWLVVIYGHVQHRLVVTFTTKDDAEKFRDDLARIVNS